MKTAGVLPDTWDDFADECDQRVTFIEASKDDGMYAQLYARDVGKLLRMLEHLNSLEHVGGHGSMLTQHFYEEAE